MADAYLSLFITICIAIVGWSIIRLERIYQFPFFMASVFLSFILPQAISLLNNPGISVTSTALERTFLYTSLCSMMCWVGYKFSPNLKWLEQINVDVDEKKLFKAGYILLVIGLGCTLALSNITIQTTSAGLWTGPATIIGFFSGVLSIALPLFLLKSLKRPTLVNITMTGLAALPILRTIILAGRRQPTIAFLITVGLCFFLIKRFVPPRLLLVMLIPIAAYLIPTLGSLRGNFWSLAFAGDWDKITFLSQQSFDSVITGDILELRNAALVMDYVTQYNQYGYGAGLWNAIIFQYVPGQIVGYDLKQSLQFDLGLDLYSAYGYNVSTGTTPTGVGDSFMDFGYFGCLFFAFMGSIFKTLWTSGIQNNSILGTLLYISLIDSAMVGITHGIGRFICEFIFKVSIIFLIRVYCKSPRRRLVLIG